MNAIPAAYPEVQPWSDELRTDYARFTEGLACVELAPRTALELTGPERSTFLHNFCTNHIRRLTPGTGCEAFFTNVQGKTLGHGLVFCGEESLLFDGAPGQGARLIKHLQQYQLRTKVEFHDRTDDQRQLVVASRAAAELVARLLARPLPEKLLGHLRGELEGVPCTVRRVPFAGPDSLELSLAADSFPQAFEALRAAGLSPASTAAWEARRLEAGWPEYGSDIGPDNFPHEVNRVDASISFVKGCYLGQEIVARMDSLGHANWLLMGLRFDAPSLPAEVRVLEEEGKPVVRLMSRSWSPRHQCPLALGYVRREFAEFGRILATPWGRAELVPFA